MLLIHVIYLFIILFILLVVCLPLLLNKSEEYYEFFVKIFTKKPRLKDYKIYFNQKVFIVRHFKHDRQQAETLEEARKNRLKIYQHDLDDYNETRWKEIPVDNEKDVKDFLKKNPDLIEEYIK